MVDDESPLVAFQLVLSLPRFSGSKNQEALSQLESKFETDPWFKRAIAISSGKMLD
jgi:hypothetical protein